MHFGSNERQKLFVKWLLKQPQPHPSYKKKMFSSLKFSIQANWKSKIAKSENEISKIFRWVKTMF